MVLPRRKAGNRTCGRITPANSTSFPTYPTQMAATTIPSTTSGSDVIQSHFVTESGRIPYDLWSYTFAKSPWSKILPRAEYKKGMGENPRAVHMQRSLVGTSDGKGTWATHGRHGSSSAATGNSPPDVSTSRGLPPVSVAQARTLVRTFNRVWGAVESPRFDVRDITFDWQFENQLEQYYQAYLGAAGRMWDYKQRETYFNLCENKVILGKPLTSTPLTVMADLTVTAPSSFSTLLQYTLNELNAAAGVSDGYSSDHSVLTGGVLNEIKARLDREGAGDQKGMSGGDGTVYPLVCSPEQSYFLRHEPGVREDLRFSDPSSLLKGLGYNKSLNGFTHMTDVEVPRFTLALVGSKYDFTEVAAYTYQSGSISTTFSAAAAVAADSALTRLTTVPDTSGIIAGSYVTIAPTSASDDDYSGSFQVVSVVTNSSITIRKTWDSDTTVTGIIYNNTNGESGWVPNSSYSSAPYEMSFILHPELMKVLIPTYPNSLGNGANFDANCAIGQFNWLNIQDEDRNPDKSFGYWRGILEFAAYPMKTAFGWAIMHRRASSVVLASPSYAMTTGLGVWS